MSKTSLVLGGMGLLILAILAFNAKPEQYHHQIEIKEIAMLSADKPISDWHEFTAPSKKFKVLLPTLPQHAQDSVVDPKSNQSREYDMYVSEEENGTVFMINLITITSKEQLNENSLTNLMHDMLAGNPHSKLKNVKMGKYHDYPSIEFSFENEQATIDGKAFMLGNTLYLLTLASKPHHYNRQEFDFFINSFELLSS